MDNNEYVASKDKFLKKQDNGLLLSDYHVSVLKRNGIDYKNYSSLTEILFDINDILDIEDNDELEIVAREIDERNYYSSNKN